MMLSIITVSGERLRAPHRLRACLRDQLDSNIERLSNANKGGSM
jgi:hypothetical protein